MLDGWNCYIRPLKINSPPITSAVIFQSSLLAPLFDLPPVSSPLPSPAFSCLEECFGSKPTRRIRAGIRAGFHVCWRHSNPFSWRRVQLVGGKHQQSSSQTRISSVPYLKLLTTAQIQPSAPSRILKDPHFLPSHLGRNLWSPLKVIP